MSFYNSEAFGQALCKFATGEAAALTDAEIEMFALVDKDLGERARARRAGFVEKDDATPEEKRLQSQPLTHAAFIKHYLDDYLSPLLATYRYRLNESRDLIVALEQRIAKLEQKPSVKFCGTYSRGQEYVPGAAVVHSGGLWICKVATIGAPNEDHTGWQLAVKRGSAS